MKIAIAFLALTAGALAAHENLLNIAMLQLPERYLAGIPLSLRTELLTNLSMNPGDIRLDYTHGWLGYSNDNPYRSVGATSVFLDQTAAAKGPVAAGIRFRPKQDRRRRTAKERHGDSGTQRRSMG